MRRHRDAVEEAEALVIRMDTAVAELTEVIAALRALIFEEENEGELDG